jgi:hypothetical protein
MALQAVCPGRPRSAVARAELLEGDRSWRPGRACSRCRPAAEATAAAHPHRTTVSTMNTIALTQPSARTGRRTMPGTIRLLARWRDAPGSTCCPSALDSACARLPLRARCVRPARGESRSGALSPADGAAQARKAARTGAADRRASLRPSGRAAVPRDGRAPAWAHPRARAPTAGAGAETARDGASRPRSDADCSGSRGAGARGGASTGVRPPAGSTGRDEAAGRRGGLPDSRHREGGNAEPSPGWVIVPCFPRFPIDQAAGRGRDGSRSSNSRAVWIPRRPGGMRESALDKVRRRVEDECPDCLGVTSVTRNSCPRPR